MVPGKKLSAKMWFFKPIHKTQQTKLSRTKHIIRTKPVIDSINYATRPSINRAHTEKASPIESNNRHKINKDNTKSLAHKYQIETAAYK